MGKKILRERIKQEKPALSKQVSPIIVYANNRLLGIADLNEDLLHPRKLLTSIK